MQRGFQVVSFFKVSVLKEESTHLRHKEHDEAEGKQEHSNTDQIVHGIERMKRNAVARDTAFIFVLFDLNAVGVIGTHFVQRQNVHHHQREQDNRQGHNVQCKEAVQGNTGDQVVTANPLHQIFTNTGNCTKKGYDHLRAPIGHLPPRQDVAHEGFSHQYQINGHTENPH